MDSPAERYRRRRPWPILIFLVVLLVGGGVVWFQVLRPGPAAATGCNAPGPAPTTATPTTRSSTARSTPSGTARPRTTARTTPRSTTSTVTTTLGTFVASNTLVAVRPSDPSTVELQVYNASPARGVARTLTKDLQDAGFASVKPADNDVLYPAGDLMCQSEIRFGAAGQAQARTVLIIAPCSQLVMDDRVDQSVDLALGARYDYTPTTAAQKAQLKALHDAAAPPAVIEGQTATAKPAGPIPPLPAADCAGATTGSS
ncbi:envelope integrity protein Cei [Nakamurella endophytica]|nr:envelope integrity protein Cei [Nakamurella endophytica]